ncbi:hypothetical protein BV22DRAFT_1127827 [Leucogyrophana mollusca]|uniref:Uncharacterized protein n=1 Tax=Leucogyrophana mollusca TaxID=85980 RepID=A0ACB8BLP6_9AGAM|nr:hypothetical protein BV22DRAFT_1127827 [Leucogyrophana mollusca]
MAAYRSAGRIVEGRAHSVKLLPQATKRMCVPWPHALSAAIVMCTMVTRAPTSSMAMPSPHELDVTYRLYLNACGRSAAHAGNGYKDLSPAELDRVGGGKTRLISKSSPSSGSTFSPLDMSSSLQDMHVFDGFEAPSFAAAIMWSISGRNNSFRLRATCNSMQMTRSDLEMRSTTGIPQERIAFGPGATSDLHHTSRRALQ